LPWREFIERPLPAWKCLRNGSGRQRSKKNCSIVTHYCDTVELPVNMSRKKRNRIARISRRIGIRPLLGLLAFACAAEAQPVIMQRPQYSAPPPALQQAQNNEMQVFSPAAAFLNMLQEINPYQWGPVSFRPSLSYSFLYGTGIQSSPGNQQASVVQTVSPNFSFVVGSHWTLDYSPSWTFYSSRQFKNTLDHTAALSWGTSYEDWVLGFSQGYSHSDSPTIETGAQTEQETYSTAINASYQLNTKMSLDMGLSQNLSYVGNGGSSTNLFGNLANSRSWSTMEWLNYQFWPRLNAGIGAGGGYVDSTPDQAFGQASGRVNWRATDKTSLQVSAGFEDSQALIAGASSIISPTFSASIQYRPFATTQLSLNASRATGVSYFENQNIESTSLTAGLNQRLLRKFNLGLSGGYSTTDYITSTGGASTGRTDDTYSFSASLSHSLTKRGTISVSYSYSENSSSAQGLSYSSNQIGVQVGYQF
jgi:hypothetical protein